MLLFHSLFRFIISRFWLLFLYLHLFYLLSFCSTFYCCSFSRTSPSDAAASSVFSGSTKIVGDTTVAITKSLSVIVGVTFSGNLTEDIFKLLFISVLSKSTIISFGIFSVGHFSSTFLYYI